MLFVSVATEAPLQPTLLDSLVDVVMMLDVEVKIEFVSLFVCLLLPVLVLIGACCVIC